MEKVTIVDQSDQIIGLKEKKDILYKKEFFRVSALWLENSNGEILLAQRSYNKAHHPGKWGVAVEGTVSENESYEECIIREIQEELGINLENISKHHKYFHEGDYPHFHQFFVSCTDKNIEDFKIDKNEVEKIIRISKQNLLQEIQKNPEKYLITEEQVLLLCKKIGY